MLHLFPITLILLILPLHTSAQMSDQIPEAPPFLTVQAPLEHPGPAYLLQLEQWRSRRAESLSISLRWYAPDMQLRIRARWIPSGMTGNLEIPSADGETIRRDTPGMAEFLLYGQSIRLFPLVEGSQLLFLFRDATARTSTSDLGRYLYTGLPTNGIGRAGEILLDFNRSENPPCAYQPVEHPAAPCLLAPSRNRLTIPIPAGEQRLR